MNADTASMQFLRGELARLTDHNRRLQGEVDELRAAAVSKARAAVNDRDNEIAQRSTDRLVKYHTKGATVGELRAALARLPAEMEVIVAAKDDESWIDGRVTNCGVDTWSDGREFFSIDVSGNEAEVAAEDARRRGQ